MKSNEAQNYCAQFVQENDPDRYLISMFAPVQSRGALWALFAFNHEIAKTRSVVSETQLGLIRLQWWREAINAIYDGGEVLEHGVVQALAVAIKTYDLPLEHFENLIYAREFDLEDVRPGNLEGLLNYADFTTTPLMKLALHIFGGDAEGEPVQPISVNYALAGILRSVPHFAQEKRCLLPEDMMKAHGQRLDHLYDLKPSENLPELVSEIAEHAVFGVKAQSPLLKKTQKLAEIYLKQLKSADYDVFSRKIAQEPTLKVLRLAVF